MLKNIGLMVLGLALAAMLVVPGISTADNALTVEITSPTSNAEFDIGQAISFGASVAGGSGAYVYTWDFGDSTQASGRTYSKTYTTAGQRTVTVTVTDTSANQASANVTINIIAPAALSANIVSPANNAQLTVGRATDFEVLTTGGSGAYVYTWDFGDSTQASGRTYSKTYTTAGQRTVTVTVTDTSAHQISAQVTINVLAAPTSTPTPTVELKVNNSDGPITISAGESATLAWSTTNATACTASGAWSGARGIGDSASTGALAAGTYVYTLTCTGAGGSANDSVTVNVPGPQPTVTVSLKANNTSGSLVLPAGTNLTLSWTSANTTACAASANPVSSTWTGTKDLNGSQAISPVPTTPGNYVYTLTCNGVSNTVTVTVPTPNTDPLVITNVRVTDITQTTAIVRWTTNRSANSRVIYDTTSHPNISGASEPNFSYAHSTATQDESTLVIEHAVTLTGLIANTQYYFRVLSR